MRYFRFVNISGIDLTKTFNAGAKLPEDYVNAYTLRSALKNALDDLNNHHSVNETLQKLMRAIDRQIKNPATSYRGQSDETLIALRQHVEGGVAW
jgi:hypothetical protein